MPTFQDIGQMEQSRQFFSELFRIIKLPQVLRTRYFEAFKIYSGVNPEDAFNITFPHFPLRMIAAPLTKSKTILRLDHLQSNKGNALVEFYIRRRDQFAAELSGRALCMLTRLPYCERNDVFVIHDMDAIGTNLLSCPGPLYSFWVPGDEHGRVAYRIYMQAAKEFFAWEYIRESVVSFIGSTGFLMDPDGDN
jgi:hypothetical protein